MQGLTRLCEDAVLVGVISNMRAGLCLSECAGMHLDVPVQLCMFFFFFFVTHSALNAVNYADQDGGAVHGGRGRYTAFELDELKDPT